MKEGTPDGALAGPQRRRSPRLASPASAAVKRSIAVRKIAPRSTAAPPGHDKENTPGRRSTGIQQKKPEVSTPDVFPGLGRRSASSAGAGRKKPEAAMPSPILSSPPPLSSRSQQPAAGPEDAVWSQKVRRSYSRISDKLLNSPDPRETFFGFEKLQTPEVVRRVEQSKAAHEASESGLSSFTSLLEADENCSSSFPEPDPNIPGVTVFKERRRRRKVQQIDTKELDVLAARMNAEFQEAEEFELVVE
ncbi:sororin [Xenentodon cancila]